MFKKSMLVFIMAIIIYGCETTSVVPEDCSIAGRIYNDTDTLILVENVPLDIFPDCLTNLKNIKGIAIFETNLLSIPYNINNLNKLQYIFIGGSRISSIPENLYKLDLINLVFNKSNLTQISNSIGNCKNLEYIAITKCNISEIPSSIFDLKKLYELDLSETNIRSLPPEIGKLKDCLKVLDLIHNGFSDAQLEELKILLPNTRIPH